MRFSILFGALFALNVQAEDTLTRDELARCVDKGDELESTVRAANRQEDRWDDAVSTQNSLELNLSLAQTNMNNAEYQYNQCWDYSCQNTWERFYEDARASYNQSVNRFNAAVERQNDAADEIDRLDRKEDRLVDWLNDNCVGIYYNKDDMAELCRNRDEDNNQFCRNNGE